MYETHQCEQLLGLLYLLEAGGVHQTHRIASQARARHDFFGDFWWLAKRLLEY